MDIEEALPRYLAEIQPAAQLFKTLCQSWSNFVAFCHSQGLSQLEEVTAAHIDGYHWRLLWEPGATGQLYSGCSVNQFLCRIRQILRWSHEKGHLASNPAAHLKLTQREGRTKALLSWEELETLFRGFDLDRPSGLRDAALFSVVMETPIGLAQTLELVLGQEKHLELDKPTRELVDRYLGESRPLLCRNAQEKTLFISQYGTPFGRESASCLLRYRAKLAGLPIIVSPRLLRRSYLAHLERQAQNRHFSFNRNGL